MVTKYVQLYENLKAEIQAGSYKSGDKLPTEKQLEKKGYSRNTVRQALALLEAEGLIIKRQGSGSIVKPPYKGGESGNVAVMVQAFTGYIFPETLQGITDGLRPWGTPLLYSTKGLAEEEGRILQELNDKEIDALIVQGHRTALPNPNFALFQSLIDKGVPVVFIFTYYTGLQNHLYVANDDTAGACEAVRYLYEHGRRKIGGVFIADTLQGHARYAGYYEELGRLGMELKTDHVLWLQSDTLNLQDNVRQALKNSLSGCDALVCANDFYGFAAVEALQEEGKKVPDDVAVLSFDNSYMCEYAPVPLTSMDCNAYDVGYTAAQKVKKILAGGSEQSIELPWTLVKRDSA